MTTAAHEQWRPALLLTRSFVADYVRNPVNLVVLVLVPLVFVMVAARSLADTMALLGGDLSPHSRPRRLAGRPDFSPAWRCTSKSVPPAPRTNGCCC